MRRKTLGVGLGVTLSLVALVTLLAFGLASLSVTHSQVLTRMQQQRVAENAARSVTHLAIERILARPDFGRRPEPALVVEAEEGRGVVAFDPAEAGRLGIPASLNNLNGGKPVQAAGGSLSPGNARIVAEGRCGGARKLLECSLNLPSFPYAVAAGGRINCSGGVTVAAVDSLADLDRLGSDPSVVPGPAGLSSNCPGEGVVLLGPSLISGDVESVGSVRLNADAKVLGEIHSPKDSLHLPEIQVASFDPQGRPTCRTVSSIAADVPIRDQQRLRGDVVVDGDIRLSNGEIYVDGSLHIRGTVKGTGAIVTTGNLTMDRGASLEASNRAALVCGGDLTLTGQGGQNSCFSGLVYCQGQLRARQLTILGSLLTGGDNVNSEQVDLEDCRVIAQSNPVQIQANPQTYKVWTDQRAFLVRLEGSRMRISNGAFSSTPFSNASSLVLDPDDRESVRAVNATIMTQDSLGGVHPGLDGLVGDVGVNWRSTANPVTIANITGLPENTDQIEQLQVFLTSVRSLIQQHQAPTALFTYDPSQFLQWRDRVKISRWRSL